VRLITIPYTLEMRGANRYFFMAGQLQLHPPANDTSPQDGKRR